MSYKATAWALQQTQTTTANEKFVLTALAHFHSHTTGLCDPGIDAIAELTGLGRSTVKRALKSLEQIRPKVITVHRRSRAGMKTSSRYDLHFPVGPERTIDGPNGPTDPDDDDHPDRGGDDQAVDGSEGPIAGNADMAEGSERTDDGPTRRSRADHKPGINQDKKTRGENPAPIYDLWHRIKADLRNWRTAVIDDPHARAAIAAMGGKQRLAMLPRPELDRLKFEFRDRYTEARTIAASHTSHEEASHAASNRSN